MANSSLVDVVVKADPSNFTAGRGGFKINHITIHHMAGVLTAAQCGAIFARKGRGGSSNYGVGSDGKVGLYVNESDRAWADSNWTSNCTTVSIETSNSATGGNWPVSALTFDKLVLLVADIAKRNGLGRLVPGKNLTWHSMYAATACVPVDTEVLTKSGWKSIHDVEEGEDIATAHIDDLSISFSPVLAKVPEKEQDTWEIRGVEATADHRMLWKTQGQDYWRVSQLKDLPNDIGVYIPSAGKYVGAGVPLSDNEIRLLVAVQADGHYEHGAHSGKDRVTFHISKERKIALLDSILSKYEHNKYLHADGTVSYNVRGIKTLCDKWLEDKRFTFEWLEMSPAQARIFLDALLDFDGCRAGNDYSSSDQQNVDVVDAVAAINGVGVRHNGDRRTAFVKNARTITKESNRKRHQQTKVSCVTVASGFILIRQHGRTTIVGNCPGDYLRSKMQELADRANDINYPPAPAKPEWKDIEPQEFEAANENTWLYNIMTGARINQYSKGTRITLVQSTVWNGTEYLRTQWSKDKGLDNGFKMADLKKPEPIPTPEPTPEPEPEPTPEPEPEPEDPTVGILQKIIDFIKHIIDLITKKEK